MDERSSRSIDSPEEDEPRVTVPPDQVVQVPTGRLTSRARSGPYADEPGAYAVVVRSTTRSVDPGGVISIECFFTGYGVIGAAKLFTLVPVGLIAREGSTVSHSIGPVASPEPGDPAWQFGRVSEPFEDDKGPLIFRGLRFERWKDASAFFDLDALLQQRLESPCQIVVSEVKIGNAPVVYELRLNDKAPAGDYAVQLCFTYFNGIQWCTSEREVTIHVSSFWERHQGWLGAVGVLATVVGLAALFL